MATGSDKIRDIVLSRVARYADWRRRCILDDNVSAEEWGHRCYRAYHKLHEPSELQALPEMRSYFPLVALKVDGSNAAVYDMIAGVIDEPFMVRPTPVPKLSSEGRKTARAKAKSLLSDHLSKFGIDVAQIINDGGIDDRVDRWMKQNIAQIIKPIMDSERALAQKAADVEQLYLRDLFAESNWREEIIAMMHDGMLYPAGYIRGPFMQPGLVSEWDGNRYKTRIDLKPAFRRIPFFNAYMADDANSANTGSGFAEVSPVTMSDFARMFKDDRYDKDALRDVLEDFDYDNSNWIPEIPNIISGTWRPAIGGGGRRFDTIDRVIFQGVFSGSELAEVGITGVDRGEYAELEVEVIGPHVIRVGKVSAPGATRNVYSACYRYSPDGYGRSMGVMLYHSARRLNRLYYLIMKAAQQQSGATYAVAAEAWQDTHDPHFMEPFMVSFLDGRADTTSNAVRMLQAQPTFPQLLNLFMAELKLTDEITGVSVLNYATPQSTAVLYSATGISAMMATAQKQLKMYLHNIDTGILNPMLKAAHRMVVELHHDKLYHAVDAEVSSVGLSARVSKEIAEARLGQNLQAITMAVQAGIAPPDIGKEAFRQFFGGLGLSVDTLWPDNSAATDMQKELLGVSGMTPMQVAPNTLATPEQIKSLESGGMA